MRLGIDVGGTNTDAVLMRGRQVVAAFKTPTTPDVSSGIDTALRRILAFSKSDPSEIRAVMIGTTHFTNAVVEGRDLAPTAAVRLGAPATMAIPPMTDWPDRLRQALGGHAYVCRGGHEFDGREISALDLDELKSVAAQIGEAGVTSVALTRWPAAQIRRPSPSSAIGTPAAIDRQEGRALAKATTGTTKPAIRRRRAKWNRKRRDGSASR